MLIATTTYNVATISDVAAALADPAPSVSPSPAGSPPPADALDPVDRRTMQVHFLLGTELYKDGDYRGAIDEWKEVLRIQPDHALAKEKIRKAREKLGHSRESGNPD
jgi:hypothetical protein